MNTNETVANWTKLIFVNSESESVSIILEPWGMEWDIPSSGEFSISLESTDFNPMRIEYGRKYVKIWATDYAV